MKKLEECLVCGNKDLKVFCDIGKMPLVNNLKSAPDEEDLVFPLLVNECPLCTHKQLSVSVDRELMFKEYLYQTGVSKEHLNFFSKFSYECGESGDFLDIGCNDGSMMWKFIERGWKCIGIEPAKNFTWGGLCVINDFFPTEKIKGRFDVITAFNVFAHNDNPKRFLHKMAKLLKPEGRIYILTTPARQDNFYHEHISYFTPQSMMVLAKRCGVEVVSFKEVSMHGKSYLFEISHNKEEYELMNKMDAEIFKAFTGKVVAYGASASEIVLFNYYKIKPEYVVDDNLLKQGKFIPGINSPVVPCGKLEQDKRDLTIIVAHHLFDEISKKIKELRSKNKDKFVRLI